MIKFCCAGNGGRFLLSNTHYGYLKTTVGSIVFYFKYKGIYNNSHNNLLILEIIEISIE